MKFILQHSNSVVRRIYKDLTGENPLHSFKSKYYKREYVEWMEEMLNKLLEEKINKIPTENGTN